MENFGLRPRQLGQTPEKWLKLVETSGKWLKESPDTFRAAPPPAWPRPVEPFGVYGLGF